MERIKEKAKEVNYLLLKWYTEKGQYLDVESSDWVKIQEIISEMKFCYLSPAIPFIYVQYLEDLVEDQCEKGTLLVQFYNLKTFLESLTGILI